MTPNRSAQPCSRPELAGMSIDAPAAAHRGGEHRAPQDDAAIARRRNDRSLQSGAGGRHKPLSLRHRSVGEDLSHQPDRRRGTRAMRPVTQTRPMTLLLFLLCAAVAGCGGQASRSAGGASAPVWTSYRSAGWGYTVSFPRSWHRATEPVAPKLADPREILSLAPSRCAIGQRTAGRSPEARERISDRVKPS